MQIRTQSIYMGVKPVRRGEPGGRKAITDQEYIPIKDLLEDFRIAGENLARSRSEYFHDKTGKDDMSDFMPLDHSLDPTEVTEYIDGVVQTLTEKEKKILDERKRAREKAEASRQPLTEDGKTRNTGATGVEDLPAGAGSGGN